MRVFPEVGCPSSSLSSPPLLLLLLRNDYPVLATLRSKTLNYRGRGPGRPAQVGPALSKSPARNLREEVDYIENRNEEDNVPVLNWENQGDEEMVKEIEFAGDEADIKTLRLRY